MRAIANTTILYALILLPNVVSGQAIDPARPQSLDNFGRGSSVSQLLANAQTSIGRGDHAGAMSALRQAVALDEKHKPARKALIQLLLLQGALKEASEQAQTFARLHPEETESFLLRAMVAFQSGRLSEASELAEAIITLLQDENKMRMMGERGYARIQQHFTWDRVMSKVEAHLPLAANFGQNY